MSGSRGGACGLWRSAECSSLLQVRIVLHLYRAFCSFANPFSHFRRRIGQKKIQTFDTRSNGPYDFVDAARCRVALTSLGTAVTPTDQHAMVLLSFIHLAADSHMQQLHHHDLGRHLLEFLTKRGFLSRCLNLLRSLFLTITSPSTL